MEDRNLRLKLYFQNFGLDRAGGDLERVCGSQDIVRRSRSWIDPDKVRRENADSLDKFFNDRYLCVKCIIWLSQCSNGRGCTV